MEKYLEQAIKTAISEYHNIENLYNENNGKKIYELHKIFHNKYNVYNYDGELFDIETERLVVTIREKKGKNIIPCEIDNIIEFDRSQDLSGEWIDTELKYLQALVK